MSVIVAVRDLKASAMLHPHCQISTGVAIRSFGDAVLDKQSSISAHPQDFQFFHCGNLDDRTGIVTPLLTPELLASAIDFVKVVPDVH